MLFIEGFYLFNYIIFYVSINLSFPREWTALENRHKNNGRAGLFWRISRPMRPSTASTKTISFDDSSCMVMFQLILLFFSFSLSFLCFQTNKQKNTQMQLIVDLKNFVKFSVFFVQKKCLAVAQNCPIPLKIGQWPRFSIHPPASPPT